MEAMIFAAGLGTRLYPITKDKPKALAPFLNGTLLEFNLKNLAAQGIHHFIINTHHFGDKIVEYLERNKNFGLSIDLSPEEELLDTAGGMAKARQYLSNDTSPVLLYNVDVITDLDIQVMLYDHRLNKYDVTLATRQRPTSRYLLFDENAALCGWHNIKTGEIKPPDLTPRLYTPRAFSGIQILSKKAMHHLEKDRKYSLIDFYLEQMHRLKIKSYSHDDNYWFDCGKADRLTEAEDRLS